MSDDSLSDGLRDLADFLDQHPGLPEVRVNAWISQFRQGANARADLTALALALGDRAREVRRGDDVRISGEFGPVVLHADADVTELGGEKREIPYSPILPSVRQLRIP